jgi:hypothetical protein
MSAMIDDVEAEYFAPPARNDLSRSAYDRLISVEGAFGAHARSQRAQAAARDRESLSWPRPF